MFARLAAWIALSPLLIGCQRMTLEGTVTDPTGAPLPDSRVAVVGALCTAPTDATGHFSLPCTPGQLDVAVMHTGYVSREIQVEATEKRPYSLGTVELLPIPTADGLFALHGATWLPLDAVILERRLFEPRDGPLRRSSCLAGPNEGGTPVPLDATLYARAVDDVEVFRLDEAGCARHLERTGQGWSAVATVRPERREERVAADQRVIRLTLEPGRYVVAPWRSGDFVEDPAATREAGDKRYSGFLLLAGRR